MQVIYTGDVSDYIYVEVRSAVYTHSQKRRNIFWAMNYDIMWKDWDNIMWY